MMEADDFPSWNLSQIYESLDSIKLQEDFQYIIEKYEIFKKNLVNRNDFEKIAAAAKIKNQFEVVAYNIFYFHVCTYRMDLNSLSAKNGLSRIHKIIEKFKVHEKKYKNAISKLSLSQFNQFIQLPHQRGLNFYNHEIRKETHNDQGTIIPKNEAFALSDKHQKLLIKLKKIDIKDKSFDDHANEASQILSEIFDLRIKEDKVLYKNKYRHNFLTTSIHGSRLKDSTFNHFIKSQNDAVKIGQKAVEKKLKYLKKNNILPKNLTELEQYKKINTSFSFNESKSHILEALYDFSNDIGDFAFRLFKEQKIQMKKSQNMFPNGFTSRFYKNQTPFVFAPYFSGINYILLLAHEIGHAYHFHVQRDLKVSEERGPATLAETASTLFEEIVREFLYRKCEHENNTSLLMELNDLELNNALRIPYINSRFQFEHSLFLKSFEEKLNFESIVEIYSKVYSRNYGVNINFLDKYDWIKNTHLFASDIRFYNYQYLFGWILSLKIAEILKSTVYKKDDLLKKCLRESGKMTCEDFALKFFNLNIEDPYFWKEGFQIINNRIENLDI